MARATVDDNHSTEGDVRSVACSGRSEGQPNAVDTFPTKKSGLADSRRLTEVDQLG
jgi:hypothetical protein